MIEIFDCEQGTPEWYAARAGIPTASEFKTILGIKKDAKEKLTRQNYMMKLAGEIMTGEPMESYSSGHMDRGREKEDEARKRYAFVNEGVEVRRVGFIRNGQRGCSPDSLVGEDGGLEIKSAAAHIQIERLLKDEFPPEHKAQVQGSIWLAERGDWWDFVSYCPRLPPLTKRVFRDDEYIKQLSDAVDQFNDELAELVTRIRRYGASPREILKNQLVQSLMAG